MKEEWRDILNYEGLYQVSNLGRVKSLPKKSGNRTLEESILSQSIDKGYARVSLHKDKVIKNFLVHRLVAYAFLDNPNECTQVNHKDENKLNNNVNNLEWCNAEYNMNYGTRTLRSSKPVYCVTTNKFFNKMIEAANFYNIKNVEDIGRACKGKRGSCGKDPETGVPLKWEYVYFDEELESIVNHFRSQLIYWQNTAAETKTNLESYRTLVDALIKNGIISEEELLTIWDEVDEGLYDNKEGE